MPKKSSAAKRGKSVIRQPIRDKVVGVALANVNRTREPKIEVRAGLTYVSHREYVGDVFTDPLNVYAYDVFVLNPANPTTFPWLSVFANRFESYRFTKLEVEFRTYTGSTTGGQVLLAIDYDSQDDTSSATKTNLLNTGNSTDAPMWSNNIHRSRRADLQRVGPWRFVDESAGLENTTDRLNSTGNLFVATTPSSVGGNVGIGEVWIDYELELMTPVLHSNFGSGSRGNRQSNAGSIASSTDVLSAFSSSTALTLDPFASGFSPTLAMITVGQSGAVSGPPSIASSAWSFVSGTVVPNGTVILAAISDFAGSIGIGYATSNSSLGGVNLASAVVARVQAVLANSGAANMVDFATDFQKSINTATGGLGSYVLDCFIPKGAGIAISAPTFSMPTNTLWSVDSYPSPVGFSAFRHQLRDRRLKAERETANSFQDLGADALSTQSAGATAVVRPRPRLSLIK